MSFVTRIPVPNLWDEICKDFAAKRAPIKEDDEVSLHTNLEDYNPAITTPVFYGQMYESVTVDDDLLSGFDPAVSHPACVGYVFVDRPPSSPPATPPPPPSKKTCSPIEYLEYYVFPVLLPALEEMLHQAKREKCFERKRTKFNALDFITEYLYRNNPCGQDRDGVSFEEIPFVQAWWKDHPRTPLPMSLLWTEEEATLIIQSFYRGYKVRIQPEIQEMRQWQRDWREEKDVNNKVDEFWSKQMPENPHGDIEPVLGPDMGPPASGDAPSNVEPIHDPDKHPSVSTTDVETAQNSETPSSFTDKHPSVSTTDVETAQNSETPSSSTDNPTHLPDI